MRINSETEEVYQALVSGLAYSLVPTSIMGATLIAVGSYAYAETGNVATLACLIIGTVASVAKIGLIERHRRTIVADAATEVARRREYAHAAATFCMAASVGGLSSSMFLGADESFHLVATGLLFGYCSGVASRVSIRPWIAKTALFLAAIPTIAAAVSTADGAHYAMAAMFAIFMIGALETVRHVHTVAVREITMRFEMRHLALHDPLTGLMNRLGLRKAFTDLARAKGMSTAVYAFDLDRFKAVNDRLGHAAGDRLLAELGDRLRVLLPNGILARVGGDEFVVVQSGPKDDLAVERSARRIHDMLTAPYHIGSETVTVGLSLGYCIANGQEAHLDAMLRNADASSYRVKRAGGGLQSGSAA